MKKTIIISIVICLSYFSILGDEFDWVKNFKISSINKDNKLVVDSEKNIITSGTFSEPVNFDDNSSTSELIPNGKDDIYVAKLDKNGDYIWSLSIGGNGYEEVKSIKVDESGNIYIVGVFQETVDFDPSDNEEIITSEGGWDVFILKLTSSGDFLWVKQIGSYKFIKANSMDLDNSNNIYITGYFFETVDFNPGNETYNLTASIDEDIYILKLNSDGEFVWAKSFEGTSIERGISCVIDNEQNICLTGLFEARLNLNTEGTIFLQSKGFTDVFVIKLDKDGNYIWAKSFEGAWSSQSTDITVDKNDNIYTTGYFSNSVDFDPSNNIDTLVSIKENEDVFISKMDKNGNHIWAKMIGGTRGVRSNKILVNSRGEVITVGYYERECDFDPNEGVVNAPWNIRDGLFLSRLDSEGNYLGATVVYDDINPQSMVFINGDDIILSTTVTDGIEYEGDGSNIRTESKGNSDIFIFKQRDVVSSISNNAELGSTHLFPNPFNGLLNIKLENYMGANISIYTETGSLIKKIDNVNQSNIQIELTDYNRGIYIVRINQNGITQYYKVLNI